MSPRILAEKCREANRGRRKLSAAQVREARLSLLPHHILGVRFGVPGQTISQCRSGRTYGPLRADEKAAEYAREAGSELSQVAENTYQAFDALKIGARFPVRGRPDLADRFDRVDALDAVHECEHGRLAEDRTPPCGCWPQREGFGVVEGKGGVVRPARRAA